MSTVQTLAFAIRDRARSFEAIRRNTGLRLTDEQFLALVGEHPDRFKLVHFLRRDDEGQPIRPGRPGVGLRQPPPVL